MTKQELVELLIKEFYNKEGNYIDLSGLDFGEYNVSIDRMRANSIDQSRHTAQYIWQNGHFVEQVLLQNGHHAYEIHQDFHRVHFLRDGDHEFLDEEEFDSYVSREIGDIVKIIQENAPYNSTGKTGTIVDISFEDMELWYLVQFDEPNPDTPYECWVRALDAVKIG